MAFCRQLNNGQHYYATNDCEASEIGCMHAGAHNGNIVSQGEPGVRLPLEQQLRACASATSDPVPMPLLRKYIAYAKTFVAPVLSAESKEVRFPHYVRLTYHMSGLACAIPPKACPAEALSVHQ